MFDKSCACALPAASPTSMPAKQNLSKRIGNIPKNFEDIFHKRILGSHLSVSHLWYNENYELFLEVERLLIYFNRLF
jgi:hypothetical protein